MEAFCHGCRTLEFFIQIHGLPVGRMVFTGMVAAALLVPLYRHPANRQGTGVRGTGAPAKGGSGVGSALSVPVCSRSRCLLDPGSAQEPLDAVVRGRWFSRRYEFPGVLRVGSHAAGHEPGDLRSGQLLLDLGLRILALAGIFAASGLTRLRRESRLREQRYLRELETAHRQLQDAHTELQAAAERAVTLVAVEERNGIARDLHDILGHTLTVLVVQLQAVKRLLPGQVSRAVGQLDVMEELSRQGAPGGAGHGRRHTGGSRDTGASGAG